MKKQNERGRARELLITLFGRMQRAVLYGGDEKTHSPPQHLHRYTVPVCLCRTRTRGLSYDPLYVCLQ